MSSVVYPVIIKFNPSNVPYPYFAEIPAVDGFTEGKTFDDALRMAEDYIGMLSLGKKEMPPSQYVSPKVERDEVAILASVDLTDYKQDHLALFGSL